jgi:hypothetical protein
MAIVAQTSQLMQTQLALEKANRLVVKIALPASVELGATPDEPPLIDAMTTPLAIGQTSKPSL